MPIWTNTYLNQLLGDAAQAINNEVPCLFHRFFLLTTAGLSKYTLPDKCSSITRITWRGIKVDPISWEEYQDLSPATAYVNPSNKIETTISKPYAYALHPTDINDIRFFPTPDETFTDIADDPYSPAADDHCIVSCWRTVDETLADATLPDYIARRTKKAYAAWRAFEKDGKGQNSLAAKYYQKKYKFLIDMFKRINEGCFVSKKYSLESELEAQSIYTRSPVLPSNFERVRYR